MLKTRTNWHRRRPPAWPSPLILTGLDMPRGCSSPVLLLSLPDKYPNGFVLKLWPLCVRTNCDGCHEIGAVIISELAHVRRVDEDEICGAAFS